MPGTEYADAIAATADRSSAEIEYWETSNAHTWEITAVFPAAMATVSDGSQLATTNLVAAVIAGSDRTASAKAAGSAAGETGSGGVNTPLA